MKLLFLIFSSLIIVGLVTFAGALLSILLTIEDKVVYASEDYGFKTKWGTGGTGNGQFYHNPAGVAVDNLGNVYVTDNSHTIQKFNSDGRWIATYGPACGIELRDISPCPNAPDGQFFYSRDIAVDSQNNLYIVDQGNKRIQKFNSDGNFVTKWGSEGSGNGQFFRPFSIAVDRAGDVYVVDAGRLSPSVGAPNIQKFTLRNPCPSNTQQIVSGVCFVIKWGSFGTGIGRFSISELKDIAVDLSGNVYVTDGLAAEYQHVQKFTLTNPCPSNTQQIVSGVCFVREWGSYGTGDGQFRGISGIDVDSTGDVYVTDAINHNIQKFTGDGNFVTKWGSYCRVISFQSDEERRNEENSLGFIRNNCNRDAGLELGDGQFKLPYKIEVYPSGNVIYISDYHNLRVQKFIRSIGPTPSNNQPPSANAGQDQRVLGGEEVRLSGMSTDPENDVRYFSWRQVPNPYITVTLEEGDTPNPRFTAPYMFSSAILTFEMTVTDEYGRASSDTVDVTISGLGELANCPPGTVPTLLKGGPPCVPSNLIHPNMTSKK